MMRNQYCRSSHHHKRGPEGGFLPTAICSPRHLTSSRPFPSLDGAGFLFFLRSYFTFSLDGLL